MIRTAFAALLLLAAPAHAATPTASDMLTRFCEPLLAGSSAAAMKAAARAQGFRDQVVLGQPVLQLGELFVAMSDSPRVCFVQGPIAMTRAQGFALVDAWGTKRKGWRAAMTHGPDGAPVRAWTDPANKISLIASEQTALKGHKVMAFIMMPAPKR